MLQTQTLASTRFLGSRASGHLCKTALAPNHGVPLTITARCILQPQARRSFHSSQQKQIKEYFPPPEPANARKTKSAWSDSHPVYTKEEMESIIVAHRNAKNWSDYVALGAVRVLRWGLDIATGYRHSKHQNDTNPNKKPFHMTEEKYMVRNLFLETVAGVPGWAGASIRHLNSLRRMKRDNGWIETLYEEAWNERMHLLTFMKMAEPGRFMRFMVLGAQGVFVNLYWIAYIISARTCHRFVGYLEEEAVLTYSRELEDLDKGRLPKWEKLPAPQLAIDYWKMPEGHRMMRDVLLYVRADEAKHREVNHTFANLDQKKDVNPYADEPRDLKKPYPGKDLRYLKPTGWEREEIMGKEDGGPPLDQGLKQS